MAYTLVYVNFFLYLCSVICAGMEIMIVIGLVGAAMLLLSVGVILRKDHSFRSQHIHQNKRMKEDGIHCALSEDKLARKECKLKIED